MENFWLILLVLIAVVVLGYLALNAGGSSVADKIQPVSFEHAPNVEYGVDDETVVAYNMPGPAAPEV